MLAFKLFESCHDRFYRGKCDFMSYRQAPLEPILSDEDIFLHLVHVANGEPFAEHSNGIFQLPNRWFTLEGSRNRSFMFRVLI